MILQWRTREGNSPVRIQLANRLSRLGLEIFDELGFVQDQRVPRSSRKSIDVPLKQLITRNDQIARARRIDQSLAIMLAVQFGL